MRSKKIFWSILVLAFVLRIYRIEVFPPGLYSDETAYGYNAYSLLKTGLDEFGQPWPLTFKNFGDYKPPMTAWLTIPFVALFGLNELAVRLPSVLAGTLTIAIIYFLTKEMFPKSKGLKIGGLINLRIEQIAAFLLAISPWHLHFSRSSMLVAIEAMFISLGLLLFLKSFKNSRLLYLSSVSFVAAIYTYYGSRITVPLLVLSLMLIFYKKLKSYKTQMIGSALLGLLLLYPLIASAIKSPETLTGRAKTISVFYDPGIRAKLWEAHTLNGESFPPTISRVFHNKGYFYFRDILRRYLQHFSTEFIAVSGDATPPFDIPGMGQVYWLELLFGLTGLVFVLKNPDPKKKTLVAFLLVSPIAASLTFITPASNRSFNLIIGLTILSSLGILKTLHWFNERGKRQVKIAGLIMVGIYTILFSKYLNIYYHQVPNQIAYKWHNGRRELVEKVSSLGEEFDSIVFSNREGPAYIWLLFFQEYDPNLYRESVMVDETPDELGWIHVASFDKYKFSRNFDWETEEKNLNSLYVGYEDQIPDNWEQSISGSRLKLRVDDKIYYPNGETAFKIVHLEKI